MPGNFVGRAAEMGTLYDMCMRALTDDVPVACVLIGEPGAGKTRLLAELRGMVQGGEHISMAGYELERTIPLAAARSLLLRLDTSSGDAVDAILSASGSAGGGPMEPVRLFEAAHRALTGLGPVLLVVDDLHWVDDTSVALLHYLIRAADLSRQPLAVVAASRRSSVASDLAESCTRLLGPACVLEVVLGPLNRAAGIMLAQELGPGLDEHRATQVWRAAAGSPFWLDLLATSSHLDLDVGRVVSDRLRGAGADAATVLSLLALLGRPLTLEDIAELEEWAPGRVDQATDALEREGLAVRVAGTLSVTHDLIRDAVARTVPPGLTRRLHRRLGAWLEHGAGDDLQLLAEALEHQHLGNMPVVALATRLSRSPRRRFLGIAGLGRLGTIADDSEPGAGDGIALRVAVASLATELGQRQEALRRWSELSSLGRDPIADSRAALKASEAALGLALRSEAWRHWERARIHVDEDPVLRVEILTQQAALEQFLEHHPDESRAAAAAAVAGARSLLASASGSGEVEDGVRRALLGALLAGAEGALLVADPEQMLALADELDGAAEGFDEGIHIRAAVDGALALRFLGHNLDAEARLRRTWDEVRRQLLPHATIEVGAVLGTVLLSMGQIVEADNIARECLVLGTRLADFGPARAFFVVLPHLVELTRGDWRLGVEGLVEAARAEMDPHYRQHAHRERATACARLDPRHTADDVRTAVVAAVADAEAAACRRCLAETTVRGAEALARIGDLDRAGSLFGRAEVPASDAQLRFWHQRAEVTLHVEADVNGRLDRAALRKVLLEAERQSLHLEALWVRLDLGSALAREDRTVAAEVLRAVGADAQRLGAITEQRVAEQQLRWLGVRTWRREAAAQGGGRLATLSSREKEIALLVAGGASNPEIAATVFVSRKTVERHVSNILAKLGARNRAELAALFASASAAPERRGAGRTSRT